MFFVSSLLIDLVTFPGIVLHALAHEKTCDLLGIPVHEAVYFQLGGPASFVDHADPGTFYREFATGAVPFAASTAVALAVFTLFPLAEAGAGAAIHPALEEGGTTAVLWLGLSIAIHAFPDGEATEELWERAQRTWPHDYRVLPAVPVVALFYLVHRFRVVWPQALYGVGLFFLTDVLG